MPVESATYVNDLTTTNPVGATDLRSTADDHLRLIKSVLKATFPGMAGAFARVQAKSADYTPVANDNTSLIRGTAALTLNLTAAATLGNQWFIAVMADGGAVTVDPNGAETINGSATLTIADGESALIWCNGTAFFAITFNFARLTGATFTGVVAFVAGAVGAPGITFSGDTNTGIYSPGADRIGISTGGVLRVEIEADGDVAFDTNVLFVDATNNRVGIGTITPSQALHVAGSVQIDSAGGTDAVISESGIDRNSGSAETFNIQNSGAGAMTLQVDGSPVAIAGRTTEVFFAQDMISKTTNGAADGTLELASGIMVRSKDFDATTAEYVHIYWVPPKSWDEGNITARCRWTGTGSGDVIWRMRCKAYSNGDDFDSGFTVATRVDVTDTGLGADFMHTSPESANFTIEGSVAEGDFLVFEIERPAVAGDTYTADAKLVAMELFYTKTGSPD